MFRVNSKDMKRSTYGLLVQQLIRPVVMRLYPDQCSHSQTNSMPSKLSKKRLTGSSGMEAPNVRSLDDTSCVSTSFNEQRADESLTPVAEGTDCVAGDRTELNNNLDIWGRKGSERCDGKNDKKGFRTFFKLKGGWHLTRQWTCITRESACVFWRREGNAKVYTKVITTTLKD
jgi:hypothetical protein